MSKSSPHTLSAFPLSGTTGTDILTTTDAAITTDIEITIITGEATGKKSAVVENLRQSLDCLFLYSPVNPAKAAIQNPESKIQNCLLDYRNSAPILSA
jgi:hypothetical protein